MNHQTNQITRKQNLRQRVPEIIRTGKILSLLEIVFFLFIQELLKKAFLSTDLNTGIRNISADV